MALFVAGALGPIVSRIFCLQALATCHGIA
jgi:hypothetical protein